MASWDDYLDTYKLMGRLLEEVSNPGRAAIRHYEESQRAHWDQLLESQRSWLFRSQDHLILSRDAYRRIVDEITSPARELFERISEQESFSAESLTRTFGSDFLQHLRESARISAYDDSGEELPPASLEVVRAEVRRAIGSPEVREAVESAQASKSPSLALQFLLWFVADLLAQLLANEISRALNRESVRDERAAHTVRAEADSEPKLQAAWVSTFQLNLRAGPSTTQPVLATLAKGQFLVVGRTQGRWVRVCYLVPGTDARIVGWVARKHITRVDVAIRQLVASEMQALEQAHGK